MIPRSADDVSRVDSYLEPMSSLLDPLPPPTGEPLQLHRPRRWPTRVGAVALVVIAAVLQRGPQLVVPLLFVLVVPFEKLFPRHRQPLRRPELATDIAYGLATPALQVFTIVVGIVVGFGSLAWLPGLALRPFVTALPALPRLIAGVIVLDLVTYWIHRFSHEVSFLWRFHAVHHSTENLDWVSGLRVHPLDGAFGAPGFILLIAAGFTLKVTGVLAVVQLLLGLFLHANVRWRWRRLNGILITPEFHHWHHSSEPEAINTNYSVFLPVWDLLFGTYRMPVDRRPSRYGIDEPMPTGLVNQLRYPLRDLPPFRRIVGRGLRHPVRTGRHLTRAVRRGLAQLWASARRRTGVVHSSS